MASTCHRFLTVPSVPGITFKLGTGRVTEPKKEFRLRRRCDVHEINRLIVCEI